MAERRYWDANAFIALLRREEGRSEDCLSVIEAADNGKVEIITSSLTLVEVIKLKGQAPLPADCAEQIRQFFKRAAISVRSLDRFTAEQARQLIWQYGIQPKDAAHVATAMGTQCQQIDTYDEGLLKLTGKLGKPPLRIVHPKIPHTPDMFPGEKDRAGGARRSRGRGKKA